MCARLRRGRVEIHADVLVSRLKEKAKRSPVTILKREKNFIWLPCKPGGGNYLAWSVRGLGQVHNGLLAYVGSSNQE